jgi:hypothetical protein
MQRLDVRNLDDHPMPPTAAECFDHTTTILRCSQRKVFQGRVVKIKQLVQGDFVRRLEVDLFAFANFLDHQFSRAFSVGGVQILPNGLALDLENTINHPGLLVAKKTISDALKTSRFSLPVRKKVRTKAVFEIFRRIQKINFTFILK